MDVKGKGKKGAVGTNPVDDLADQSTNQQQAQRPAQIQLPGTRGVGGRGNDDERDSG
jgi:hypothetical protein